MLPPFCDGDAVQPVVYLISGFRWSFYGVADVSVAVSLADSVHGGLANVVAWIFKTGYG